ncbi:hypothetical protein RUND412_008989 [Rhizina undulata]
MSSTTKLNATDSSSPKNMTIPQVPHYRTFYYIGGLYTPNSAGESLMHHQMYVEKLSPLERTKPYPLLFIHGKAMTGTNFLNTPDGRPGWAPYFLHRGYEVFIIDQPTRGRSGWVPTEGEMKMYSAEYMEAHFTAIKELGIWPQARLYTQWPGTTGRRGDEVFDQFFAGTVQFLGNDTVAQYLTRDAIVKLLEKEGPMVLVTHSQGGLYGWPVADSVPHLVKGILAVEPGGPQFENKVLGSGSARAWGLTDIPMTYEPPVSDPREIEKVRVKSTEVGRSDCLLQKEPARVWPRLRDIPVAVVTSEASYHAVYDHCIVGFLKQVGIRSVDSIRLEELGVRGNGHMMMLEKNNLEVAQVLDSWVEKIMAM